MLKQIGFIVWVLMGILNASCSQEEEQPLILSFTGDVLLDRGVRQQIERKGIDYLFEDVSTLFHASDAVIINLECPVTDTVSPVYKKYIFRANPEWMQSLHTNGITHAALANNHSMDQGRRGLESTSRHLLQAGIIPLGQGENQSAACAPTFISKGKTEVALFNSVLLPLENWVYMENRPGVCQATVESLITAIQSLKKRKPDCYVLVILHWGIEYQLQPTLQQRQEARQLIEAGADAIIGHHPHVVQKEEIYKGKPVFYSLGNFIFDQNKPETTHSVVIQIKFDKKKVSYIKTNLKIINGKPNKYNWFE
jgi:poly-gamma-glutamate synthesis protein (capsule biosynthesis protein)